MTILSGIRTLAVAAVRARATQAIVPGVLAGLCAGAQPNIRGRTGSNMELPSFCPQDFGALSDHAGPALRRMRRCPTLGDGLLGTGWAIPA